MRIFKLIAEWVVGVWRLFTRPLWVIAMLVVLVGCVSPDTSIQTLHGVTGKVNTIWADVDVRPPTILQKDETALHSEYGTEVKRDMPGTFSADVAGNVNATGVPAYLLALAALCRAAPDAPLCVGTER